MDCYQDLTNEFVAEAKEHLSTIEDQFLALEKQATQPDMGLVDNIFRGIHSIKGAAGFLGLEKIGDLAHVMETLLQTIRAGETKPESQIIDALLQGADLLAVLVDDVENSSTVDIQKVHDRISSVLAKATSPRARKELATPVRLACEKGQDYGFEINEFSLSSRPANHSHLYVLEYDLRAFQEEGGLSPAALIHKLLDAGLIIDGKLECEAKNLSDDLTSQPLIYRVLFSTDLDLPGAAEATNLTTEKITEVVPELLAAEPDEQEEDRSCAPCSETPTNEHTTETGASPEMPNNAKETDDVSRTTKASRDHAETVRIHVDILDQLMTLAGELVLVRNQHMLSANRSDPVTRGISQRLDIVTSELQETIMRTRMQPIGNVFSKLPRIGRDLSKKLKKGIEITTTGNEVELDKTILESLADPLMHIIRNSCDHGIETPAARERLGKAAAGRISVRAYHEGGQINIKVTDDGRGIDVEAVRRKAEDAGFRTEAQLAAMTEKEILSLITLPGFSTAKKTTDVSGRGVGMDVVKTAIEQLGGSLDLDSTLNKGTSITLRLPLTLAIIPCLVVTVGAYRYAIPQVNLEELVCLYDEDLRTKIECAGNQEVYRLRNHLLPMVRLNEVLDRSEPFTDLAQGEITETYRKQQDALGKDAKTSHRSLTFAVVKVGTQRFGLMVDRVIGTEEIVVKPMHPSLKTLGIYSGATVMGDGQVALILDIEGIAHHAGVQLKARQDDTEQQATDELCVSDAQTVLLFKSGPSEQFAVSLPMIRRIERITVDRIERIGDKQYVTIDGASTLLLHLENVLNVSPCIEQEEISLLLPKHVERPFGIVMSNVVDIAEATTQLNIDSYDEAGVLGTAIVANQMTLFLDIYRLIELAEPDWFAQRRKSSPPPQENIRILLVEDTLFFRRLVKGYLEADNYRVTTAEHGKEALEILEQNDFDLVISDIEMPVMNGFEFIKALRRNPKYEHQPAIALTALSSEADMALARESGYDRYRVKIDREELLREVADLLGSRTIPSPKHTITAAPRRQGDSTLNREAVLARVSELLETLSLV